MTDFAHIAAASERIKGNVLRTPLLNSPFIDEIAGRRVFVKAECLQVTGSFKARGGWAAISALDAEARARGVLAFSSGNHAQGVARAAAAMGAPAVIVMPADAPKLKIANTRALGAEVILYDRAGGQSREALGETLAKDRGLSVIKPFDHPEVIAGQGTTGLEIAAQAAEIGANVGDVLVCCGGGGLTAGIALALEETLPKARVRPVEPAGFDDVARSLASGQIEHNAASTGSICDAILTPAPGELTFPILSRLSGPGIVVSDDDCLAAMRHAFLRLKIVVEPGGAAALAAALFHGHMVDGEDVVVVASGGNADPDLFARALASDGT